MQKKHLGRKTLGTNNSVQAKSNGKKMNGHSVEGIPVKYEGALRSISYSGLFYEALENVYLTPASYIIVNFLNFLHLKKIK